MKQTFKSSRTERAECVNLAEALLNTAWSTQWSGLIFLCSDNSKNPDSCLWYKTLMLAWVHTINFILSHTWRQILANWGFFLIGLQLVDRFIRGQMLSNCLKVSPFVPIQNSQKKVGLYYSLFARFTLIFRILYFTFFNPHKQENWNKRNLREGRANTTMQTIISTLFKITTAADRKQSGCRTDRGICS